jgi:putative isomerase
MSLSRRAFIRAAASLSAVAAVPKLSWGQAAGNVTAAPVAPTAPVIPAVTPVPAVAALAKSVGPAEWTELRARLVTTNANIRARGLRKFPGSAEKLLTGYPYNEFYDWDLYFENLYLSYYGVWPYCFSNLKLFLDRQQADGYVNRSLIKQRDRQHFKPFLAQLVVLGCKQNHDDYAWLRDNYYGRLKKYLDKWMSYDGDGNGLPVWNSADAAGTDNQWSRAGQLAAFEVEGVDLASYLVREFDAMAVIAERLGLPDDAKAFTARGQKLSQTINDVFWDEKDGFYYDRNEKTKQPVKVKSGAGFMPLFSGSATPERAKRIVQEHLLNEKEFWLKYPVASYAKTEPDYYQGSHNKECNWRGSTWAPFNYMIFQGLRRYGFNDNAKELAARLFEMAVVKNPVLREYYNAETGEGLGQTQFWGFTALYYVMPMEFALNYDASSLRQPNQAIIPQQLGVTFEG